MNRETRVGGFTLVELLVAMTIAAVMLSFAIPAFNDFTSQRRMTASVNLVVSAVNYARSEAAHRGRDVSVQAFDAENDDEWGAGFCVIVGAPGDCNDPLRIFQPEGGMTFDATDDLDGLATWTFDPRGLLDDALVGEVRICGADEEDDPGRVLRMTAIGRVSAEQFECFP